MHRTLVPGLSWGLSAVGLSASGTRGSTPQWERLVARSIKAGVNLFDLADVPLDQEGSLWRALKDPGAPIVVILRRGPRRLLLHDARGTGGAPTWENVRSDEQLARLLESSLPERSDSIGLCVEWDEREEDTKGRPRASRALRDLVDRDRIHGWGRRLTDHDVPEELAEEPPAFVTHVLSLLHTLTRSAHRWHGPPLFARDPLASGRLDGTHFDDAVSPLSLGRAPIPLREMRDEYEPVLRLAPLVRPGQRTLLQAALRYAIDIVGAQAVLVPAPDPRRLDELLGFESSLPLDDQDRALLDRLATSSPPISRSAPFSPV